MNILLIVIVMILFIVLIIVLILCRCLIVRKCCKCAQTLLRKLENKLMFNSVLRAVLESYFLVCITAIYGVKNARFDPAENTTNFIFGVVTLIFLVAFPIQAHRFLLRKQNNLGE